MRSRRPRVIRDNKSLFSQFDQLTKGDIVCCRLRLKPGEEHLMLDLAERGVRIIPSLRSQLCSRSKAFQTRLFSRVMPPETTVIYTQHDLIEAIGRYAKAGFQRVVVKQEGKNGGLGVYLFQSIEDVYNHSAFGVISYPYVLQPFISNCRDLRVIIIGDYIETYERINPNNFRHNIHCGGISRPCELSDEQLGLCRTVMTRGEFPYGHIDLMITDDSKTYVLEINLRGGLKGARIKSEAYHRLVRDIEDNLVAAMLGK